METCTAEQKAAITAVLAGKSIFLTGPGGTGKSYLLDVLKEEYERSGRRIAVTALTGCAALLLGPHAKTLHSWAGIGLGRDPVSKLISDIALNGRKKKNWNKTDCLIIDEVSMLQPELLSTLDQIGRVIRKQRDKPMGGLQVVFVGDFHQLPPVNKETRESAFAFQSPVWKELVQENFQLTQIHRQTDPVFQTVLNEARVGALSADSYTILASRKGVSWKGQLIRPTLLFTRNDNVNELNRMHLDKLAAEEVVFKAKTIIGPGAVAQAEGAKKDIREYFGKGPAAATPLISKEEESMRVARLDKDAPYDPELCLKVGAQVMLIINKDPEVGLVNGSRGVVTGFSEGNGVPLVRFLRRQESIPIDWHTWESEGDVPLLRSQIPLRLAYALTIHKAQGASLDSALVDIGKATFEYGQAYVALSRVRNLEGLYVYDIDPIAFRVHPAVKAFYEEIATTSRAADTQGSSQV